MEARGDADAFERTSFGESFPDVPKNWHLVVGELGFERAFRREVYVSDVVVHQFSA